jgi:hypothetical protein
MIEKNRTLIDKMEQVTLNTPVDPSELTSVISNDTNEISAQSASDPNDVLRSQPGSLRNLLRENSIISSQMRNYQERETNYLNSITSMIEEYINTIVPTKRQNFKRDMPDNNNIRHLNIFEGTYSCDHIMPYVNSDLKEKLIQKLIESTSPLINSFESRHKGEYLRLIFDDNTYKLYPGLVLCYGSDALEQADKIFKEAEASRTKQHVVITIDDIRKEYKDKSITELRNIIITRGPSKIPLTCTEIAVISGFMEEIDEARRLRDNNDNNMKISAKVILTALAVGILTAFFERVFTYWKT